MPISITQPMIQFLALGLITASAFFFAREVIVASPESLSELTKSKRDYNPNLVKTLSRQKADAVFGFLFLMVSVFLQGINLLFPTRWIDFEGLTPGAMIILVTTLIVIFLISLRMNKNYTRKTGAKIRKALGVEK